MIKIIDLETEHLTEYEKKYVFTEAPTEKERVNVKRISLRAPDKRTYDFRKGADDEPEENTTENKEEAEEDSSDNMKSLQPEVGEFGEEKPNSEDE